MNIFNFISEMDSISIQRNVKFSKMFLATLLLFGNVSVSQANIIVDVNAENNQQPTFAEQNEVIIINIQATNTEGISHNKYSQFDVDAKGVVLNNFLSTQPDSSSIISPLDNGDGNNILIGSNESLRESGAARIILNEVTSLTPSKLNGSIAVVGQKADVIIANPAGIECNGCGFINTHIASLSAASPVLAEGSVKFLSDNINGEITLNGTGLSKDANQSDHTTLIAGKINVNAPILANKGLYLKLAGDKNSMHTASLNISELGRMYADKISIRGTGQNIGVHNKGEIKANAGLELDVSGLLDSPGVISSAEYFSINSENFNTVFDKDENYSLAQIIDNMMLKENAQGVNSEIQSTVQDFSPKLQLTEKNKIKEINVIKKSQEDFFETYILPAHEKYNVDAQALRNIKMGRHINSQFMKLRKFEQSKNNYLWIKSKYDEADIRLNVLMTEFKDSFANSGYSYYQNMREESINDFFYIIN